MYNRYIFALDIVYHNLSNLCILALVPKKEQVPSLKSRFHATGQDDDDRRRRIGYHREALPEHESRGQNKGEIEDLGEKLPRLHGVES